MSEYWSPLVNRLTPYVPGAQRAGGNITKLNTNENPYPPSPRVLELLPQFDADALRRYPDPESLVLRQALAQYHDLSVEQVFVGNGSDEVLALAFMAFFTREAPLEFPAISYSFYPVYCDLLAIQAQPVALTDNFSLNLTAFGENAGGVVFPNPNAPTGRSVELADIEALLQRFDSGVVLVDEAYADFGAESAVSLIERYPNLLVTRTFSKGRSLAGMRIGAALGHPALIEGLQRVKNSFNSYPLDAVAQAAAVASLSDEEYYRNTVARIVHTREQTRQALHQRGFTTLPSSANFIFAQPPASELQGRCALSAFELFSALDDAGVLVRHWSRTDLCDWLRISIGTEEDMSRLFRVIDDVTLAGPGV